MATSDLQTKLDQLEQHIQTAEAHLKLKGMLSSDHEIKAAKLRERYEALSQNVQAEVADAEAHGHHVSDLEQSVRQWIDSLEMKMG